jgi:hypothetical protein
MMTCPKCGSAAEMAYSVLFHGFVCLDPDCGFELEMAPEEALTIVASPQEDLVLA